MSESRRVAFVAVHGSWWITDLPVRALYCSRRSYGVPG